MARDLQRRHNFHRGIFGVPAGPFRKELVGSHRAQAISLGCQNVPSVRVNIRGPARGGSESCRESASSSVPPRAALRAVVGLLLSPGKRPVVASVETQATSTLRNSDRRTSALIGGIGDGLDPLLQRKRRRSHACGQRSCRDVLQARDPTPRTADLRRAALAPGACRVRRPPQRPRRHRSLPLRPSCSASPVPEPVGGRIRRGPILCGLINEYETAA